MVLESATALAAAQALGVYAAIAASPGPNTFAVGAEAALRGLRATLPLCAGVALGVALAAAGGCVGLSSLSSGGDGLGAAGRAVAAAALLLVALRLGRAARPAPGGDRAAAAAPATLAGGFGLGLLTAAGNPVSWAYFAGACAGPAGRGAELLVPGAGAVALLNAVLVASLLSRPGPRGWAERNAAGMRVGAAGLLGAYAGWTAAPLLVGA